jgi:hypothetical protein
MDIWIVNRKKSEKFMDIGEKWRNSPRLLGKQGSPYLLNTHLTNEPRH